MAKHRLVVVVVCAGAASPIAEAAPVINLPHLAALCNRLWDRA
jgi:hypothetical protein